MSDRKLLLDEKQIAEKIHAMVEEIIQRCPEDDVVAVIGIRTRGVIIAQRMKKLLEKKRGQEVALGVLDITLYRDDLSALGSQPIVGITNIPFDVGQKRIILVDDVIYTGRTIRAALDAIVDFGRPKSIILAALVDRGLREYPIQPDIVGEKLETEPNQVVQVRLEEVDGDNNVTLLTITG